MRIRNVYAITSDNETELYDNEKEAVERAFEMMVEGNPLDVTDWFESLDFERQKNILNEVLRYSTNEIFIEKV